MPSELVDLVYLDPPFNSVRNYNLLFKQHKGQDSPAQIMAFEDTWKWSHLEYQKFCAEPRNAPLHKLIASLYDILGDSEMMAYIVMMAPRLLELHRVLKPTGSLYLHCDPVASHYLKIVLDVILGPQNFRNEITWKRATSHNDAKRKFGDITDTILFFSKSGEHTFNVQYVENDPDYLDKFYRFVEPGTGRRFALDNIASPNPRPNLMYEWRGFAPPAKGWRYSLETMEELAAQGLVVYGPNQRPRRKRYADTLKGLVVGCLWDDIGMLQHASKEHRGYPTQKPLALLEPSSPPAAMKGTSCSTPSPDAELQS